jgi:hypothetical protein
MMVVGIIAQLPHIPLHDINISRVNPTASESEIVMTLLSAGESFCGIGGIKHDKYIKNLVPIICGNLIARFLANSDVASDDENVNELITACVQQMARTLGKLVSANQSHKSPIMVVLNQLEAGRGNSDSPRPESLDIGRHFALSRTILNLSDDVISELANKVRNAAKRELTLIGRIAPAPTKSPKVHEVTQQRDAVNAVCSFIWRHTQERGAGKDADARDTMLNRLEEFAELTGNLSIAQRTWLIILMDFELRDKELGLRCSSQINKFYKQASNELDFRHVVRHELPTLDLSDTDLTNLYNAINGLREAIGSLETPDIISALPPKLLSPDTQSIIKDSWDH